MASGFENELAQQDHGGDTTVRRRNVSNFPSLFRAEYCLAVYQAYQNFQRFDHQLYPYILCPQIGSQQRHWLGSETRYLQLHRADNGYRVRLGGRYSR